MRMGSDVVGAADTGITVRAKNPVVTKTTALRVDTEFSIVVYGIGKEVRSWFGGEG
jgi:hypothetical protein